MRDAADLGPLLRAMDGQGYKAYQRLGGAWSFPDFTLHVDHVQADPFAALTRVRVTLPAESAALPPSAVRSHARALGTAAFLARSFASEAGRRSRPAGTGRSGEVRMAHPGQLVLRQTAVQVEASGSIEARFGIGLPARGRRVRGDEAARLLTDTCPALVRSTLPGSAHPPEAWELHAATNEDAESLRAALNQRGDLAFVADGSRLPRRSGVDDRPLADGVVAFRSPDSLRITVELPNAGPVSGMAVPGGVTLVVGGGYHGKTTLLRALQDGVYNHCAGDGRERVVAVRDTVKVRAEDGRSVACVDISPFIDGLPMGRDTHCFQTENASGSTSQAAAIVEAIESGAQVLLLDEDTSATNFMIRDRRMQRLVPDDAEPITPFVDRVRSLHDTHGVSTVLVIGGSGDYLDVADRVIRMADYQPHDVSEEARTIAREHPTGRQASADGSMPKPRARSIEVGSMDPRRGRRERYVRVHGNSAALQFGEATIDLTAVEQLLLDSQTRAIGWALALPEAWTDVEACTVPELLDRIERIVSESGLDAVQDGKFGDLAEFRRHEVAAVLSRLRSIRAR